MPRIKSQSSFMGAGLPGSSRRVGRLVVLFMPGVLWLLILGLLLSCRGPTEASRDGSGTNTGNSISAAFTYPGGPPAAKVAARIRPEDYGSDPGDARWTTDSLWANGYTDSTGVLYMENIPPGRYLVEVNDQRGFAWHKRLDFTGDSGYSDLKTNILQPTGGARGVVAGGDSLLGTVVQVLGLEAYAWVDPGNRTFAFSGIPTGDFTLRALTESDTGTLTQSVDLHVSSNRDTVLQLDLTGSASAYPQWKYTANLLLDNSVLGIASSAVLLNTPVPLPLSGAQAPFSQFLENGDDLRISNPRGDSVDFEIEYWDSDKEEALIWILVDSISGSAASQSLTLHWGNPLASPVSSGPKVFSTEEGYHGVWHMNTLDESGLEVPDNSEKSNEAILHGKNSEVLGDSLLGSAVRLDGTGQFFSTSILDTNPQPFAVSLWFKTQSNSGGKLAGFGWPSTGDTIANYERQLWMSDSGLLHFGVLMDSNWRPGWPDSIYSDSFYLANTKIVSTPEVYNDGQWHHVVISLSASGLELFVDGLLRAQDPEVTHAANRIGYWRFGSGARQTDAWWVPQPSNYHFRGSLDEVRILYRAVSPEDVQAAFSMQRSGSVYTQFRP